MKPLFRLSSALFAALALLLFSLPAAAEPAPRLVCDEPAFDAGPIPPSATLSHDFLLRNDGQLPLEIRNVRASSAAFRLRPPSHPIPPGDSAPLRADFSLDDRTGPQTGTIVLSSNDPDSPTSFLSFRCEVVPPPAADPSFLRFGRIVAPSDATRTVTLCADRPFTVLSATAAAARYAIEIDSAAPAASHVVSVTVRPASIGPFGDTLTVETDLPAHPTILIPFTGDWHPAQPSPHSPAPGTDTPTR